jgi:hypothetical protein
MGLGGDGTDGEVMVVLADDKAAVLSSLGGGGGGSGGQEAGMAAGVGPGGQPSIQQLQGPEQVAAIFERTAVVSFDMVLALAVALAPSGDPAPLLELVKKHAVLVRGNWVRKSSLCGLPPRLAAARDALLLLFLRYGGVSRMQFAAAAGLGDEEALALLQPLARLDQEARMWVPAWPDDAAFLWAHPGVVAQQGKAWREREREREVAAIMQAVGTPDCPCPGPVEGGLETAAVDGGGGGGGGGRGAGAAKAAGGGKGRRK